MSVAAPDTDDELFQFQLAYEAPWLDRDRRPQVDDPAVRAGMVKALDAYTAIWRKGCTPPDSVSWTNIDNNKAFLAQTVVMTPNTTLSIPAALRTARPDDYYKNAATIDWPDGANGQPLVIDGVIARAVVFKAGRNPALAGDFVRFLVEEGWLAHWLDLRGRPLAAADAQAGRAAVLARPERSAPHARGHPDPDPAAPRSNSGSTGQRTAVGADIRGERLGQGRPPRRRPTASAPSRRSTRRSPGSSRSWRSSSDHVSGSIARSFSLSLLRSLAPLGAQAADLVVWWEKGYYAEEDEAVREIIAAFEQETGKQVELVFHPEEELPDAIEAALEAGEPPDFAFGICA